MKEFGNNLKRIRLLKHLSLKEAGELLGMSATAVSKYEKGQIALDSKKVIIFANAYDVRAIDILKVYKPIDMKFSLFRKSVKLNGQNFDLLCETIKNQVSSYLEVLELLGDCKKVKIKKYKCASYLDAEEAGNSFRKDIGISLRQPISDLVSVLENLGFVIIQIKNENNSFDGFDGLSEVVNGIPIIVLLDSVKDGARERFTIAHELGHLVMDTYDEEMCNRFAGALLMPKEAVVGEFGSSRRNVSFFELSAFRFEYKVSYGAILHRLRELDIISGYLYDKLRKNLKDRGTRAEIDPILPEVSCQFKRLVYMLEALDVISKNKACELLGGKYR